MTIYPLMNPIRVVAMVTLGGILSLGIDGANLARGGVAYEAPAGGWRYTYDGTFGPAVADGQCRDGLCPPGFGTSADTMALDGTWFHDQGDKWDGSAPGDPLSDPNGLITDPDFGPGGVSPGGIGAFVEGSTTFVGLQDTGNPESHGWCQGGQGVCDVPGTPVDQDPTNTNRRIYFGHNIADDGPLASELVMSVTGITISARVRIPTDETRLDDIYPEGVGPPAVIPWFENAPHGHGMPMVNGRGMINVVQNNPTAPVADEDTSVGFSLVTSADVAAFAAAGGGGSLTTGSGSGGLIMNNLNGNTPTGAIDSTSAGSLNIVEIPDEDLNEWNEFWITLENNGGAPGNVEVNVYRNGSLTPETFNVTLASRGNAVYADFQDPFIEFGISANAQFGSLDLDFYSYALGVHEPVAAPLTDADGDGDVDGNDFLLIQRTDPALIADWQAAYGNGIPAAALGLNVPEPTACGLALLAACLAHAQRRRRS